MNEQLEGVLRILSNFSDEQQLLDRCMRSCRRCLHNTASEDANFTWQIEKIDQRFCSMSLCFRSGLLSYPYVSTNLDLLVGDDEIGTYTLITTLDGEDIDGSLVFY